MNDIGSSAAIDMRALTKSYTYSNTEVLTLSAGYPRVGLPENGRAQRLINGRIEAQVSAFVRYASDTLYGNAVRDLSYAQENGFPFNRHEAVMNYEVAFNENCHLSLCRDRYEYTGGAHGATVRRSDTWRLKSGVRMTLPQFLGETGKWRRAVICEILRQADENMREQPGLYFGDYRELIEKYFRAENFCLTPQGVAIYYQQYEIAPYSTGIVVFVVPYAALGRSPGC